MASFETTLEEDVSALTEAEARLRGEGGGTATRGDAEDFVLALRYRVAKKHLLTAASGCTKSLGWLVKGLQVAEEEEEEEESLLTKIGAIGSLFKKK